jgi:hypothetical protein
VKRFFYKALIFLIVIGLTLNVLGTLADRVAPLEDWRVSYQQMNEYLHVESERIQAITLGNSHADSIDYPVLGIDGQSLALAAADLFEVEKIVASLEGELPNLKTVFITISYYSFSRDNAKFESLRPRRVGFYSMVPVWSPIDRDWANFLMGRVDAYTHVLSVVRSDNWKGVWPGLMEGAQVTNPFPYDGIQTTSVWGDCSHYTAEQLERHAQEIAGRNVSSSLQMANAHPGLEQDSFDALARTIEMLQSRGVQVVLYTPPYYDKYNTYFTEQGFDIKDRMKLAVGKLEEIYNIEFYDFSSDPEITSQPELFYNSDHLSDCGRRVFSAKLLEKWTVNTISDK